MRLPIYPSEKRLAQWRWLADAGAFAELAGAIVALHYDPAYDRGRKRHARPRLAELSLDPADPLSLAEAADAVAAVVSRLDAGPRGAQP